MTTERWDYKCEICLGPNPRPVRCDDCRRLVCESCVAGEIDEDAKRTGVCVNCDEVGPDPRQRGDDDGREYSDPRDAMDDWLRAD